MNDNGAINWNDIGYLFLMLFAKRIALTIHVKEQYNKLYLVLDVHGDTEHTIDSDILRTCIEELVKLCL